MQLELAGDRCCTHCSFMVIYTSQVYTLLCNAPHIPHNPHRVLVLLSFRKGFEGFMRLQGPPSCHKATVKM